MESEIKFKIYAQTSFNQQIHVLGSISELGCWNLQNGISLYTNEREYPYWKTLKCLRIPCGQKFEFKFAVFENNLIKYWENLPSDCNRRYASRYARVRLEGVFGDFNGSEIVEKRYPSFSNFEININEESVRKFSFQRFDYDPFKNAETSESDDNSSFTDFFVTNSLSVSDEALNSDDGISEDADSCKMIESGEHLRIYGGNRTGNSPIKSSKKGNKALIKRSLFSDSINKGPIIDRLIQSNLQKYYLNRKENMNFYPFAGILKCKGDCSPEADSNDLSIYSESDFNPTFITIYSFFLPVKFTKNEREEIEITLDRREFDFEIYNNLMNSNKNFRWIGMVRETVPKELQKKLNEILRLKWKCTAIFIDQLQISQLQREFYENYFDYATRFSISKNNNNLFNYDEKIFSELYKKLMRDFAKAMGNISDSTIFILSYKLFLLPQFLSEINDNFKIGLFWNSAFLDKEKFEYLPFKDELIFSLLNCNMIEFQSYYEAKPFINILQNKLGIELGSDRGILNFKYMERTIILRISRIGIDVSQRENVRKNELFCKALNSCHELLSNIKVILSYESNLQDVLFKFRLMESYFQKNNDKDIKFIQIINDNEAKIANICENLNESLKNRLFIVVNQRSLSDLDELVLLQNSHVLLEHTLNSKTLYRLYQFSLYNNINGSILVNQAYSEWLKEISYFDYKVYSPLDSKDFSLKINESFKLESPIKKLLNSKSDFYRLDESLKDINRAKVLSRNEKLVVLNPLFFDDSRHFATLKVSIETNQTHLNIDNVSTSYLKANNRIILFGLEETFVKKNDFVYLKDTIDQSIRKILRKPSDNYLELLQKLARNPKNTVYIITDRGLDVLGSWFLNIEKLGFANENGFLIKEPNEKNWVKLFEMSDWTWKDIVRKILENNYTAKTPGSYVEIKESCVIWKFELVDKEFAAKQASVLVKHLNELLEKNSDIDVVIDTNKVEVRPIGMNKGTFTNILLEKVYEDKCCIDFVMMVGGSNSDEEIYDSISKTFVQREEFFIDNCPKFNCIIEQKPSKADYWIENLDELLKIF